MFNIKIQIDITAPDEVLDPVGECYTSMTRMIKIPYIPHIGMLIHISPKIDDDTSERYAKLFHKIENVTGIFEVRDIYYMVDGDQDGSTHVWLKTIGEESLEAFHSLKQFLTFYGFSEN
ncbi:hypothetical protein [Spartinivicinus ruber]|uniref:hypothetical protein n=1 Tax=Spartinivicinus ruber TaxID=2683272 RepID=UPI0013D375D6|nr:hypothetical protein [Spartinivicinus ruber]